MRALMGAVWENSAIPSMLNAHAWSAFHFVFYLARTYRNFQQKMYELQ